jgi:hypothetical protein
MTKTIHLLLAAALGLLQSAAWAWSNHTLPSYRAFDTMPEVANAKPVVAEPLEVFLKAQDKPIAELLKNQEAWARANMPHYAPLAEALVFRADPLRSDADRRQAFLTALRISPLSRFALFLQPDMRGAAPDASRLLAHDAVNFLPEQAGDERRFMRIDPGEAVAPLAVLATASDEPDYGLDINLWDDSPSEWGKTYGFGTIPFGNPALYYATQAPFHMGFYHQDWLIYKAASFIQRTYPLMRIQQYSSLSALAFRTGHDYWGWRFAGLALHYIQDLTQPYHADLSPGDSTLRLIGTNLMAMAGALDGREHATLRATARGRRGAHSLAKRCARNSFQSRPGLLRGRATATIRSTRTHRSAAPGGDRASAIRQGPGRQTEAPTRRDRARLEGRALATSGRRRARTPRAREVLGEARREEDGVVRSVHEGAHHERTRTSRRDPYRFPERARSRARGRSGRLDSRLRRRVRSTEA